VKSITGWFFSFANNFRRFQTKTDLNSKLAYSRDALFVPLITKC